MTAIVKEYANLENAIAFLDILVMIASERYVHLIAHRTEFAVKKDSVHAILDIEDLIVVKYTVKMIATAQAIMGCV